MKILLFGDAPMALNEGGICQTLYNLFSFIPPEDFLGITAVTEGDLKKIGPVYGPRYKRYTWQWVKAPANRFNKYLQPLAEWINFSVCRVKKYKQLKTDIVSFNPDIIISCSNLPVGVLMHDKFFGNNQFGERVIPYFMDDWMYKSNIWWLGGSVHSVIGKMLKQNKHWMMISRELTDILKERYHVEPGDVLVIRNPVDVTDAPPDSQYIKNDPFTIAYAGALWAMHYDSFYAFAKAVKILSLTYSIRLLFYSPAIFWSSKKNELEPLDVVYGGHLAYSEVHAALNKADALLITSSFSDEYYTHSRASLQTKITDYCKSKRLIISCGPSYSANHNFIKEHNCGICIETNDEQAIAKQLAEIVNNIYEYQDKVTNGWDSLKNFSKEVVHNNIKNFISAIPAKADLQL